MLHSVVEQFLIAKPVFLHKLSIPGDRRKRRLQLMRHIIIELLTAVQELQDMVSVLLDLIKLLLRYLKHLRIIPRQLSDLILTLIDLQPSQRLAVKLPVLQMAGDIA